jgi:hypothetical protein
MWRNLTWDVNLCDTVRQLAAMIKLRLDDMDTSKPFRLSPFNHVIEHLCLMHDLSSSNPGWAALYHINHRATSSRRMPFVFAVQSRLSDLNGTEGRSDNRKCWKIRKTYEKTWVNINSITTQFTILLITKKIQYGIKWKNLANKNSILHNINL